VESLEVLGAGFTLATHDLVIRGAGELLGDEQSGQMHEIGFTLYTQLLERMEFPAPTIHHLHGSNI
jgi:transcription-repair coupling factor (superfamily II helicase)